MGGRELGCVGGGLLLGLGVAGGHGFFGEVAALRDGPVVLPVRWDSSDEADDRGAVGEGPDDVGAALDPIVGPPEGEGWGDDRLKITTHLGTHVDAPPHFGSRCEGRPARTIEQIGLDELHVDSVVLDVRADAVTGEAITVDALRAAFDRVGGIPQGGGALVHTGQERYTLADPDLFAHPGMSRDGTLFLAEEGARVLGTDALGWDRHFGVMRKAFERTGEAGQIWDGHFAGRDREVFIVQQLTNLAQLPLPPVRVGCFPIFLAGCSAGPARVVAFVDGDGPA